MNQLQTVDTKVARHFTILVYPFRHVLLGRKRSARLRQLGARWLPWFSRLDRDGLKRTLDDTYFFLPYLRTLLFPETALLPAGDAPQQVTQATQLASRVSEAPFVTTMPFSFYVTGGIMHPSLSSAMACQAGWDLLPGLG